MSIQKIIKFAFPAVIVLLLFNYFKNNSSSTSNETLSQLIQGGAFLVDVRTPEEFQSGSAAGAVNIPLNEIESELDQFKDKSQIIVFCKSGNRSSSAKAILEKNGIKNVNNGGTWQNVNDLIKK